MLIIFLLILLTFQRGCFNDEGTLQLHIKIYVDAPSRHSITEYIHHILPHKFTTKTNPTHRESELLHIQHYFNVIFNSVNMTLKGTNVQLVADYSDMLKHEFLELHEKYCGYLSNITSMTENFLNDFEDPHNLAESKILIMDCKHNNSRLPTSSHIATKNHCGIVNGILLEDPEVMKHKIAEVLYRLFSTKSISQVEGINEAVLTDICTYVHSCNTNFDGIGTFIKDLGILTHKTLNDDGIEGFGYKILGRFIKDFSHDIRYDDSDITHDDRSSVDETYFHKRDHHGEGDSFDNHHNGDYHNKIADHHNGSHNKVGGNHHETDSFSNHHEGVNHEIKNDITRENPTIEQHKELK